jgi:hypothetical protein
MIWLPVPMVSAYLCDMMSCYQKDVFLPVWWLTNLWILSTCIMSAYLYDVCLAVWWLANCMMPAYTNCMNSVYLYNVCLPVWCVFSCLMAAYLYDVYQPLVRLPICILSALLHHVRLPVGDWLTVLYPFRIVSLFCETKFLPKNRNPAWSIFILHMTKDLDHLITSTYDRGQWSSEKTVIIWLILFYTRQDNDHLYVK